MTTEIQPKVPEKKTEPAWVAARRKARIFKKEPLGPDLFKGKSTVEEAEVEDVPVLRISARPEGVDSIPVSQAVDNEPDWKTTEDASLPYGLEWRQTKDGRFDFAFTIPGEMPCFGLGERYSGLNVRGKKHTLSTADHFEHDESLDTMYASFPVLILFNGPNSYLFFLDSTAPQKWDLDSELDNECRIELFTSRGWRLFVFGPAPIHNLVSAYTAMTGRTMLPPDWSLGHIQCRWSYPDEDTVRAVAEGFRKHNVPCDAIVFDIDYMDDYRVFTHSKERFPNLKKLVEELGDKKIRAFPIVDPGVKKDPEYEAYAEGERLGHFCKNADGSTFIETVWPGESAFPDFMREDTRRWWADKLKFYTDMGFAGIWNDMNEPSFFGNKDPFPKDADQMPDEDDQLCMQESPEGPVGHFEVRNAYGLNMCRATYEGLLKHRPNERPFVLTRSCYAGIQRYAAVWLGDNFSWFEHLRLSIPMLSNMGLSGVPFVGVDVGGFGKDTDPELLIRWYELGIFYPFFRNHSAAGTRAQEPWVFPEHVSDKLRYLVEARYRLLPYLKTLFWQHMANGSPVMRPMVWNFFYDSKAVEIDDQFSLGNHLLVAPVVHRAQRSRVVYLPEGTRWYPLEGGQALEGGQYHHVSRPLGALPAFVKDGAILPLANPVQSTADLAGSTVSFVLFGAAGSCEYFEDDGTSPGYEDGEYNHWRLNYKDGRLDVETLHKGYDPPVKRKYVLITGQKQTEVTLP